MTPTVGSEQDISAALKACADEPVHIPGTVQHFGCMIAVPQDMARISHASEKTIDVPGGHHEDLIGCLFVDLFGESFMLVLKDVTKRAIYATERLSAGTCSYGGDTLEIHVFQSAGFHVLEIGKLRIEDHPSLGMRRDLIQMSRQIQTCESQTELGTLMVNLMRQISGFDRVILYKFDDEFNGEVIAEARADHLEPFQGLRFPHWDNPAQAREIMRRIPLRLIPDIDADPCPLRSAPRYAAPLDIWLGQLRGVSPFHLQYLRNMGSRATLTMTVMNEDRLWGMISFHHTSPRCPSPRLREVLTELLPIFALKLTSLRQRAALDMIHRFERAKIEILSADEAGPKTAQTFASNAAILTDAFQTVGIAWISGDNSFQFGQVLQPGILKEFFDNAEPGQNHLTPIETLAQMYPDAFDDLIGCAGALIVTDTNERAFAIFRSEITQEISWAGDPQMTVIQTEGVNRLAPRSSFSIYLQAAKGRSQPSTDEDLYTAERLWPVLNMVGRQSQAKMLIKQKEEMTDELNHSFRNMLALVRSISKQSRRQNPSLTGYGKSPEARIPALATAHDLGAGAAKASVSIHEMILQELKSSEKNPKPQINVNYDDLLIVADSAPPLCAWASRTLLKRADLWRAFK